MRDIIILEKDRNKKGDLFNRLVFDVFHALGFGEVYCNVTKTGREIDMILYHRTENRVALVECKAHKEKIGGSDINKFVGAYDVEKREYERESKSVVGYFISVSGFKDSAIVQEKERGRNEIILLGSKEIVEELIQGKVLCSLEKAVDAVKETVGKDFHLCKEADLIASEHGWIWVLYYIEKENKKPTHFIFVHADGNQLIDEMANELIEQSGKVKCAFSGLTYIKKRENVIVNQKMVRDKYYQYLENELGEIQFEGMPTDKEAGAVKVNLESIFVPLKFAFKDKVEEYTIEKITDIRSVLSGGQRVAILAKPGGGKSTLIRRIALAYAFSERRRKVEDKLPDCAWFPAYIRCRDLGEDATKSILEIIQNIAQRAEIMQYKQGFNLLIEETLQNGQLLLLLDGLDEISNENYRIRFVNQLRTFVATYPKVHLLITSREAGFRVVAGTLTSYCDQYTIVNLGEEEIRKLSLKWHEAIFGESEQTVRESHKICDIILADVRIKALAENPLLLTTLLFVKRWVGYLPTKKCSLYEEMVKLLLVTWNAAGHEKLDMDESEPQLAFVAYKMTMLGRQKITRDKLSTFISEARKELPEILGYTKMMPSKFIDQVEERSSLLIKLGLEENDMGKMVESYEFSHLSFQEYLTAKAICCGWIPSAEVTNIVDVLRLHFNEEHWKEVIPLTAVLSGRQAKTIIDCLIKLCEDEEREQENNVYAFHLANCVASEVPMSREFLEKAIELIVKHREKITDFMEESVFGVSEKIFDTIAKSKYGSNYREVIERKLFSNIEDACIYDYCELWLDLQSDGEEEFSNREILELLKGDRKSKVTGALQLMRRAYKKSSRNIYNLFAEEVNEKMNEEIFIYESIFAYIEELLKTEDRLNIYVAAWSIAWSGYNEANIIPDSCVLGLWDRLLELWKRDISEDNIRRVISWAICSIVSSEMENHKADGLEDIVKQNFNNPRNDFDAYASIHIGVLFNLCDKEAVERCFEEKENLKWRVSRSKFLSEKGYGTRTI